MPAGPAILGDMDQDRDDYADRDLPPGPDPRFYWRVGAALGGLLVIAAITAVIALAGVVAYQDQRASNRPVVVP